MVRSSRLLRACIVHASSAFQECKRCNQLLAVQVHNLNVQDDIITEYPFGHPAEFNNEIIELFHLAISAPLS